MLKTDRRPPPASSPSHAEPIASGISQTTAEVCARQWRSIAPPLHAAACLHSGSRRDSHRNTFEDNDCQTRKWPACESSNARHGAAHLALRYAAVCEPQRLAGCTQRCGAKLFAAFGRQKVVIIALHTTANRSDDRSHHQRSPLGR